MKQSYLVSLVTIIFPLAVAFASSPSDTLQPRPTLTGYLGGCVHDDQTGEPIKGARVSVNNLKKSSKTNGEGYYLLEIPVGTYTVSFKSQGCKEQTQVGIVIRESATTTQDVMMLRDPSSSMEPLLGSMSSHVSASSTLGSRTSSWITGRVRDKNTMVPLGNVTVTLVGQERQTTTGSNGLYVLKGVVEGTYTLRFIRSGYEEARIENVEVKSGHPTSQTAELIPEAGNSTFQKRNLVPPDTFNYLNTKSKHNSAHQQSVPNTQKDITSDTVALTEQNSGVVQGQVTLEDTHGAASGGYFGIEETHTGSKIDEEGKFTFRIQPGSYTFDIGFDEHYQIKRVTGVVVRVGETTKLTITLESSKR